LSDEVKGNTLNAETSNERESVSEMEPIAQQRPASGVRKNFVAFAASIVLFVGWLCFLGYMAIQLM